MKQVLFLHLGTVGIFWILWVCGVACAARAQDNPCLERTVPVSVTTEKGLFVTTLGRDNFRAKFRGRQLDIVSASYSQGPRRIGVLIDSSGSMRDEGQWERAMTVAESVYSSAGPQASLALLTFARHVEEKVDFAEGRNAVASELRKLRGATWKAYKGPLGKTALLDALLQGLMLFGPARTGDALFLITDGGENASHSKGAEVRERLLSAGVRLFAFLLVLPLSSRMRTPEEATGPSLLRELVDATGGELAILARGWSAGIGTREQEQILLTALGMTAEINGFYSLSFRLAEPLAKAGRWKLEAVEPTGLKRSRLRVVYPQTLAPCH